MRMALAGGQESHQQQGLDLQVNALAGLGPATEIREFQVDARQVFEQEVCQVWLGLLQVLKQPGRAPAFHLRLGIQDYVRSYQAVGMPGVPQSIRHCWERLTSLRWFVANRALAPGLTAPSHGTYPRPKT
jgi:hypothetical protein